jgi:uncharacterized membrane-anchored protein YjiN (DUF445 family)
VTFATGVDDQARRRDLWRMKALATGLLLFATVVYVLASRWRSGGGPAWAGYLAAAAEAGMVGALADWFAVTALFRHPLGLPIPHTAIIPTRKDTLGHGLEEFVATNFLAEPVIRDKIGRAGVASRVGVWLAQPAHAERLTAELGTVVRGALAVLHDDDVQDVLEHTVLRRLLEPPWGPPAGRLLAEVVQDGAHHRLVDLAVDEASAWLAENKDAVMRLVTEKAPSWSPRFVDERVAARVHAELVQFALDVKHDRQHRLRRSIDAFLAQFAEDLRQDPYTIHRAERIKDQLLGHPEVRQSMAALWSTGKRLLIEGLDDPASPLRQRLAATLVEFGTRLAADADLQAKVDTWLEDAAAYLVTTYRAELATVISDTVNRWDAAETARKVELQVGRDLQFIRINGTVVGALAGLTIHAVSSTLL